MRDLALEQKRRTKIVCTIGPASRSPLMLERMVRSGMDVARLNLSHGTESEHAAAVATLRAIGQRLGFSVAVLMDLPGPKYRVGELKAGQVDLEKGSTFVLTSRQVPGDEHEVSLNLSYLTRDVRPGATILVDDGAIKLRVRQVTETDVICTVIAGGTLRPRKGVVVPGARRSAPFLTDETRQALAFAAGQRPDFIALSFVDSPEDVVQARAELTAMGINIPLIVKVETRSAVSRFDAILAAADGAMVARGDMGVELPLPRVPLVQKEIIRKCNAAGKPVITATQMLESMVAAPHPTRAEVADVANAVFDGTDAVMLSAETSVGKYPIQAVRMMLQVAREADAALPYARILAERGSGVGRETDDAISYQACYTAYQLGAKAIVAFTSSGSTARRVSRYRPSAPVLAITPISETRRRLVLSWGVHPFEVPEVSTVDEVFLRARQLAKSLKVARKGDLIVITAGIPIGVQGSTNMLKVEKVD